MKANGYSGSPLFSARWTVTRPTRDHLFAYFFRKGCKPSVITVLRGVGRLWVTVQSTRRIHTLRRMSWVRYSAPRIGGAFRIHWASVAVSGELRDLCVNVWFCGRWQRACRKFADMSRQNRADALMCGGVFAAASAISPAASLSRNRALIFMAQRSLPS